MKKVFLTLIALFGLLTANAQFFAGGRLGVSYNNETEDMEVSIAPEFGYNINRAWAIAGTVGYLHQKDYNSFFIEPYVRWSYYRSDLVKLFVDGAMGFSTGKQKGASSANGFELGLKPGIRFTFSNRFELVAHCGFLGFRDKYNGNSVSGLNLDAKDLGLSLYYCF